MGDSQMRHRHTDVPDPSDPSDPSNPPKSVRFVSPWVF